MRSKHVDVLLAIGIVMVVLGHRYQPENLFFPAYTFHMALFFFVSGYLATIKPGLREKLRFIAGKSRTQLFGYYKHNLFFAVVTFLLALAGLRLGYDIPSFESGKAVVATLWGFFAVPFVDGHQYHLYAAAWFILQLYLVHVLFQFVCFKPGRLWLGVVLVASVVVALLALPLGLGVGDVRASDFSDFRITAVRTSFAFLFFVIGYAVKTEWESLRRVLLAPATLVISFVLVNVVAINFGNIRYNIAIANIGNERVWVPLTTTLLIVLMVFQIAYYVASFVKDDAFIVRIGRSTMPIMIWHFSVFFMINALLFAAGLITKEQLSDNWFVYEAKRAWLLYAVPGIVVPMYFRSFAGWMLRPFAQVRSREPKVT